MTPAAVVRTRVLRLRPIVHASPVPDGIHVRGARSSFTMDGSAGLWRLWQAVSAALADGRSYEELLDAARGPAVRTATALLTQQLRAHDMLVEVPRGWGESGDPAGPPPRIAAWLAAVAPDPVDAWERIRSAAVGVGGTGPVAAAAARALAAAGVRILRPDGRGGRTGRRPGAPALSVPPVLPPSLPALAAPPVSPALPAPPCLLFTGEVAVAAAAGGGAGFVTPAGSPVSAYRDAQLIGDRIGLPAGPPSAAVLAALVGGAAAHRLVCALAGLPDPGEDTLAASPAASPVLGRPTALIARLDPLGAGYHPWWDTAEHDPAGGGPADADALPGLVEALSDPETGVLPAVAVDDLPQLPAGLARCDAGGTVVCGVGVDTAMARLCCAVGAAERLILADGGIPAVVGADARHAEGVRLRRLVHAGVPRPDAAAAQEWALSPGARRWFKAVTLRFGAPADLAVHGLAPGVFHAELRSGTALLGWAVESTAADAAAFCALAAAGALQWRAAGGDPSAPVHAPCGALPVRAADAPGTAAPRADAWIRPAGASEREDALQEGLRELLGARAGSARRVAPEYGLRRALAVAGFAALDVSP
ncbi:hypothetical protein [Actinacidiphila paucisporea]|uniref:Uncharacterized protein n=1 Tax=Actinacidiphila paucisporea TaxID=310782 RepID=A0A1M7FT61_9ACTN|nr:hypothetical protein [Actinacidiphila paucisporea]SHM06859.1 hypothetical protein SAMN05216499_10841 [Actinacidiphila paucisporea]